MQAQLPGSLEPQTLAQAEPESDSEPELAAELRQELHDLARLFTALRQGASPALRREISLDANELEGACSYIPRPWMLSPSGHAAAVAWVRRLSSAEVDSASDHYLMAIDNNKVQGLQMIVVRPSGAWETATTAGGPGWLRSWSAQYGKGWSQSGRYFGTAHASNRYDLHTGARTQVFGTAEGWLPESYLGDDQYGYANVPNGSQACFSDDDSLAAAVVYSIGRGCSDQLVIFGVHQQITQFVPLESSHIHLAWLPGSTTLVIMHIDKLACMSALPTTTGAELEPEWFSAAPMSSDDASPGTYRLESMAAMQPGRDENRVAVLHCCAIAGGRAAFDLALYNALALSSGQLSFVTAICDDPARTIGRNIKTAISLHSSVQSVAACLGPMLGTWLYPVRSNSQLGSCLFHKAGLHRLSFAHGGRFVVGILSGLAVVVCGMSGATLLQVNVNRFCHVPRPVTAYCAVLVKGHLHVAACTPLMNDWLCSGVYFSSFQL